MSAARVVLDSFALLAFLRGEPGDEKIAALLERAGLRDEPLQMTEVNYAEVKYFVIRKDGAARWQEVARELPALPIAFHPANRELADIAADACQAAPEPPHADAVAGLSLRRWPCPTVRQYWLSRP